jgi:hypothetical protein
LDVGLGAQENLLDYAVRSSFKSSKTWGQFNDLKPKQQAWREMAILGKEGKAIAKGLKVLGTVSFVTTSVISIGRAANYYNNGGSGSAVGIKATLDIAMGIVGFLGPVGFLISTTYFILDVATDGFGGYGDRDN